MVSFSFIFKCLLSLSQAVSAEYFISSVTYTPVSLHDYLSKYVYFILIWSVYYLLFLCLPSFQTHSLLFTLFCLSRLTSTDYITQVPIQWASTGLGQWQAPGGQSEG